MLVSIQPATGCDTDIFLYPAAFDLDAAHCVTRARIPLFSIVVENSYVEAEFS
jgi:hypothetical protein